MKNHFFDFYQPTADEYKRLWNAGLIVLDTNVLLNLYRFPATAREELFGVLEAIKHRLWIPHHVALEFQRKRLSIIASERKLIEDTLAATNDHIENIRKKVELLQIDKRNLGIDQAKILSELTNASKHLEDAIAKAHASQINISSDDPVRNRLDDIIGDNIGAGPKDQNELNALLCDGEQRFQDKIPPGFADQGKDKNPNESFYVFNHVKYQAKFGDLIIWKQIIQHAKEAGLKSLLFVTADKKEDWWWREQGKTIGPHPELMREIRRTAKIELFWMYSSPQFVEHANKYSSAKVSNKSIAEIEQITRTSNYTGEDQTTAYPSNYVECDPAITNPRRIDAEEFTNNAIYAAVEKWLLNKEQILFTNHPDFPYYLAHRDKGNFGYCVVNFYNLERLHESTRLHYYLSLATPLLREGRISGLSIIVVIPEQNLCETSSVSNFKSIIALKSLLRAYSITSLIIGTILNGVFFPTINIDGTA